MNPDILSPSTSDSPLDKAIEKMNLMRELFKIVEGHDIPSWIHNASVKISRTLTSNEVTIERLQECSREMDRIIAELYLVAHIGKLI